MAFDEVSLIIRPEVGESDRQAVSVNDLHLKHTPLLPSRIVLRKVTNEEVPTWTNAHVV